MQNNGSEDTASVRDTLVMETSRVWEKISDEEQRAVFNYADGFRAFLNQARTERAAVKLLVDKAKSQGFQDIEQADENARGYFQVMRGKLLAMAIPGSLPMTEGIRLIASHTDCPRLDLKQNPLYEDTDLALLKTHYYGGIKKFHWVARSLALVGTVILSDGTAVDIQIGLDAEDPIFTIPDLLPHLGRNQMEKKANEFIPAENLNVIVGGLPYRDKDEEQRVKLAVLELLNQKYGLKEEDFTTAELQIVPAEPARDAGFDRSFIAGYGQDDRVCAYTSYTAFMDTDNPQHTVIAVFFDKEEIGSEGNTGAQSRFLELFLLNLMEKTGVEPTSHNLHKVCHQAKALSADVNAALDPTYPDVFEKRNACKLGAGVVVEKYTGHGGKYGASDAGAEYASWLRRIFNDNKIVWQIGGHGKVDEGGGGTVAKFLAKMGMDIIDVGPPLLGMHSPLEVSAKEDVWMCHQAYKVFFQS
jgi:aspartyl aminopeptidase